MKRDKAPIILCGDTYKFDDDCACPDKAFSLTFDHANIEKDHDCACSDTAFGLINRNQPKTVTYMQTAATHHQNLPHDFHLTLSPYAPGGPSVLSQSAWERWQEFKQPRLLQDPIDQQLVEQALLQPVNGRFQPQHQTPETLTAWLHVTNACNLDCPYCYVRKSSARMSESIGLQAVKQIFYTAQQNNFKRVKLKYAGGESTLHFRLIRQLHERAMALSQESGLALREVILSNGVRIRPEDADWLIENGVKLMISLDGTREVHDQQRPLKNGGGSFQFIAHTIDNILLPLGIKPDITITVTQLNAAHVAEGARWALERDLPLSLNFYRQNTLSANRADLDLEEKAIIEGMQAAYAEFEADLPLRPFLNGLLDRVQTEAHAHTCGVQHSYLVITHEGMLAQCQMHLDTPFPQSMPAGDMLQLIHTGPIQNISVDNKQGCRTCEFRYRCTGGCPLETYRATGRWDVQSPHCHIYKTLLPAALRLEGLRLLKINGYLN